VATTVLDSALFRDSFGTPRMREIFEERAWRYVHWGATTQDIMAIGHPRSGI